MADEQQKPPEAPAPAAPTSQSEGSVPLSQVRSRIDKLEQSMRSNSMSGGTSQQQLDENAKQRSALVYEFLLQAKTINSMMGSVDYISARKEAERLIGLSKQFPGSPMLSGQVSGTMQDIMSKGGGAAASGGGGGVSGGPSGGGSGGPSGGGSGGPSGGGSGGPSGGGSGGPSGGGGGVSGGGIDTSDKRFIKGQPSPYLYGTPKGQAPEWGKQHLSGELVSIYSRSGQEFKVDKSGASQFQGLINDLEERGYEIKGGQGGGGYNPRAGMHGVGGAIDINPHENPTEAWQGKGKAFTNLPGDIAKIAAKHGLSWGAGFSTRDPMHFELAHKGLQPEKIPLRTQAPSSEEREKFLGEIRAKKTANAPKGTKEFKSDYAGGGTGIIDRSRFKTELANNPALRHRVMAIAGNENNDPRAQQAVIESMMNRAAMHGTSLAQEAKFTYRRGDGGYYDAKASGTSRGEKWAADAKNNGLERRLEAALGGSNISNYATGNASGSFVEKRIAQGMFPGGVRFKAGGETFVGEDRGQGWKKWHSQVSKGGSKTTSEPTTQTQQKDATRTASNIPIVTPETSVLKTQWDIGRGQMASGSAFSIGGGYYMTHAHGINKDQIGLGIGDTHVHAEVIHKNPELDYAILKTSEADTTKLQKLGLTNLPLSGETPEKGATLISHGYPHGGPYQNLPGTFSGSSEGGQLGGVGGGRGIGSTYHITPQDQRNLEARVVGASGGPVTDASGRAIGIQTGVGAATKTGPITTMESMPMASILKDIPKGTIPQNVLDTATGKQREVQQTDATKSGGTTTYFGPGTEPKQPQVSTTQPIQQPKSPSDHSQEIGWQRNKLGGWEYSKELKQPQTTATPEQKEAPIPQPGAAPLYEGKTGRRLPGKSLIGVNPELASRLQSEYAAAPASARRGFGIISAVRDTKLQAKLYERYRASGFDPRHIAARPGHSMHEKGEAVDIRDPSGWFHKHGPEFGIYPPMGKKDWPHMQLMPGRTPLPQQHTEQAIKPTAYKPDTKTAQIRQAAVKKESKKPAPVQHHHHPQQHSSEERNKVPATSQHISEHKNNWAKAHHSQAGVSSAVHSSLHTPREKQHASLGADIGTA